MENEKEISLLLFIKIKNVRAKHKMREKNMEVKQLITIEMKIYTVIFMNESGTSECQL